MPFLWRLRTLVTVTGNVQAAVVSVQPATQRVAGGVLITSTRVLKTTTATVVVVRIINAKRRNPNVILVSHVIGTGNVIASVVRLENARRHTSLVLLQLLPQRLLRIIVITVVVTMVNVV